MPLIRCAKCGQAYDVPGAVAVHLPNAIATCHCGEWLAGSKAAVLARSLNPEQIKEIDLQPYKIDEQGARRATVPAQDSAKAPAKTRSVRIVAQGPESTVNQVFTIGSYPLWIGRRGCHVDLDAPDLDLRHCAIYVTGDQLMIRDADSHMGTFLDLQRVTETAIADGEHVLRVGGALLTIETTNEQGTPVEPFPTAAVPKIDAAEVEARLAQQAAAAAAPRPRPAASRSVLVCIDGPLNGQEFEIPPTGLVVGREGHVRVPDEYLSRKHFEVMPDAEGAIRVRDLGSRNGTFLNTLPATNMKVQSGDEIIAGTNRFRIEQRA